MSSPSGPALPARMPPRAPFPLAPAPLAQAAVAARFARAPGVGRLRAGLGVSVAAVAGLLIWAMATALAGPGGRLGGLDWAVLGLFATSVAWTGASAVVALAGAFAATPSQRPLVSAARPGRTAILILSCGEAPAPIVRRVRALHAGLADAGLYRATDIFLLSDTRGPAAQDEARALAGLRGLDGVWWRQRARNTGRKPGNLADWVAGWGGAYEFMLVLDADSRMTAERIAGMIAQMERSPGTGLLQAGMRLVPARSRFGALQRLSGRLHGPGFVRGLAAWAGTEGNYWGHNALLRTEAFAAAARLPRLPGRAPFGGQILSHDFVEAAFLRRAGWAVEIAPDSRGSFEDGPQRMSEFHRRDRRWCQGNLQHARLVAAPGLHPASRLHLLAGIQSYLAAPLWLALILVIAVGRPGIESLWPLVGGLGLVLVPKLAGVATWLRGARTVGRRAVVLRAGLAELALSTLIAPLLLLRQSLAVASVLIGRDSGWQPAGGRAARIAGRRGAIEAMAGVALLAAVLPFAEGWRPIALLAPVVLPLLAAPWLVPWLEAPLRRRRGRRPAERPRLAVAAQPAARAA